MFIKKLSFYLCVVSFFSINPVDAGLREELSKKKYDFSDLVLDEVQAFNEVVIKGDHPEEVFKLMWEDVENGNEKVQEKLFLLFSRSGFYERAKTRVSLLNNTLIYTLDNLIKIAIKQKKTWAFYEKALAENDPQKKFSLLNQAVNNIVTSNEKLESSIYKERDKIKIDSFSVPIPNFKHNTKKNKEIEKFISCCKKNKNGGLLYYLYEDYKKSNEYFSCACLKAACDLGHVGALINWGNNCHTKNDIKEAYYWYLRAAKKGNVNAMFNVGVILKKTDKQEGLKWLLKAAEGGEFDAMYQAGLILRKISSEVADQIKAFNLFKVASENDQLDAMNALGEMYLEGLEIVGYNPQEAARLFLNAAEKENANSMYLYGLLLKKGLINQESNVNKGNEWILKATKKGCVAAMNHYGGVLMEWVESIKEPSVKAAYNWFLKAANKGDAASMFNLGEILWWGLGGIKENRQYAKEWLLKSANKGCVDAMIILSRCFLSEVEDASFEQKEALLKEAACLLGIAYDSHYFDYLYNDNLPDQAVNKNVLHSADQSNFRVKLTDRSMFFLKTENKINALINFAKLYIQGYVDGQKNIKKATEMILPLAKKNYHEAMDFMGHIFLDSDEDDELNHQKAAEWYKRAAESGYEPSMIKFAKLMILSPCLSKSDQNLKEALFWLQKAESLGMDEARNYLVMCENLIKENAELEISDNDILNHNMIDFKKLNISMPLQEIKIQVSNDIVDLNESDDYTISVDFNDEINGIIDDELDSMKILNIVDKDVQKFKNPKYIRDQLRKLAELKKNQQNNNNVEKKEISDKNKLIVDMLLDKNIKSKNIDYTQLINLFDDPFFENQVTITKSKSGCVITGKNYRTLNYVVASTHKKHAQTYSGLNPEFAKKLVELLAIFGLH